MSDWQFLSIPPGSDRKTMTTALINKVAGLDFEIDIKQILQYVKTYHRLLHKTAEDQSFHQHLAALPDITGESCTTPEALIARFEHIYDTPAIRFDTVYWQMALDNAKKHTKQREPFCAPVADFLRYHPFIKSEVLKMMANTFPFQSFFPDPREEDPSGFWDKYGLVYELLRRGNLELDLFAEEINDGSYTSSELDDIYNRLIHSARFYRQEKYPQAFNLLAEGFSSPERKPLLCWQRELNVLYKAYVVEGETQLKELFGNVLNAALKAFPDDEQLLILRIRFLQTFLTPDQCKGEIIATLKVIPYSAGVFHLLGQCYTALGLYQAALLIFEALKEIEPLNLKNIVAHASTIRKYADFRMNAPEDTKDIIHYLKTIKELIGFNMYDEAHELIEEAPRDHPDIKALTFYAEALEKYHFSGEKDKELLQKADSFVQDKDIIRMIYELYLHDVNVWEPYSDEMKVAFRFYHEFPEDLMANYRLGLYYFDKNEHDNAYKYLLQAHKIDPSHIQHYYILARAAADVGKMDEALEYIHVFRQYHKYSIDATMYDCYWSFVKKDYYHAHVSGKWLLSLCNQKDRIAYYFFYLTVPLALHLDSDDFVNIHDNPYIVSYINGVLDLYDSYPKPDDLWEEDNGTKSMYWAGRLAYMIHDYERGVGYLQTLKRHAKRYRWQLDQESNEEWLPFGLKMLGRYEEVLDVLVPRAKALLELKANHPQVVNMASDITYSYRALGRIDEEIYWSVQAAYCLAADNDPDPQQIEMYLSGIFGICSTDEQYRNHLIPVGKAYLDLVSEEGQFYIWVTHQMGLAYEREEKPDEALYYHQKCLHYAGAFPDHYYPEEVARSQKYADDSRAKGNSINEQTEV